MFKELLEDIPFAVAVKEITKKEHRVKCGNKMLPWWERAFETSWDNNVRILVTGHPQFMKRKAYISLLTNWVRKACQPD